MLIRHVVAAGVRKQCNRAFADCIVSSRLPLLVHLGIGSPLYPDAAGTTGATFTSSAAGILSRNPTTHGALGLAASSIPLKNHHKNMSNSKQALVPAVSSPKCDDHAGVNLIPLLSAIEKTWRSVFSPTRTLTSTLDGPYTAPTTSIFASITKRLAQSHSLYHRKHNTAQYYFASFGTRCTHTQSNIQHDLAKTDSQDRRNEEFPRMQEERNDPTMVCRPIVGYWYIFSGALVFGIVVIGGLTRLTESGLSIVEWNLIKGIRPPQSQSEWEAEFEKYQQFPEYKISNHGMTLAEFKFIFFMEWSHRMLGRFIGLSFVVPGVYFAYKGYMTRSIKYRSFFVATMIGFQGLLGWYMVKSGLSDTIMETPHAVPRVSHYWLCAHLGSAFAIYSVMLMTGLNIIKANRILTLKNAQNALGSIIPPRSFRTSAKGTACLVFLTALSGALVAGLDAGLIYNEFPYMGNTIIPEDYWAFFTRSEQTHSPMLWIRNILENPTAVQFNHRVLGCTTFATVVSLWIASRRVRLPRTSRLATNVLLGVAVAQVSLGITTLIYLVPIPLAAAHQSGSLMLLTCALWLVHTLRILPK
ncbi:hypothetical protein BASA61_003188 [Batrachochytrium salamandrivorans]|nr:hypothetical protein BASA61_003188 [Batrachochytrium salamandrivorans]